MTASEGGEPFDWSSLVPRLVHPLKVSIVEALQWIGEPLSATDLAKLFDDDAVSLSHVSYHLVSLAKTGALTKVRQRQVRGTTESFFFFVAAQ